MSLPPIPRHVAIIMDGNRRWAKQRGLPALAGHWKGAETLIHIVETAATLGIKTLTAYTFSTENWMRSQKEIEMLMELIQTYLTNQKNRMIKEGVRLKAIGHLTKLPPSVQETLFDTMEATQKGERIELVLALNYGGRDEIRRASLALLEDVLAGKVSRNNVTEELFSNYLDTAPWGDPDLLIRTSGEHRLSNFLLWQISYAEIFLTPVLWPDFSANDFFQAIEEFGRRERRKGGLSRCDVNP
jgi:undecaprenyl diphosphate synthase